MRFISRPAAAAVVAKATLLAMALPLAAWAQDVPKGPPENSKGVGANKTVTWQHMQEKRRKGVGAVTWQQMQEKRRKGRSVHVRKMERDAHRPGDLAAVSLVQNGDVNSDIAGTAFKNQSMVKKRTWTAKVDGSDISFEAVEEEAVGTGGFGKVYKVKQMLGTSLGTNKIYALKEFITSDERNKEMAGDIEWMMTTENKENTKADKADKAAFNAEFNVMKEIDAALKKLQGTDAYDKIRERVVEFYPQTFYYGSDKERPWFVMDFHQQDLASWIQTSLCTQVTCGCFGRKKETATVDAGEAIKKVSQELVKTVVAFGTLGFVHGDLKIDNLMFDNLDEDGLPTGVKLIDFGHSGIINSKKKLLFSVVPGPRHVPRELYSEEQIKSNSADANKLWTADGDINQYVLHPAIDWCSAALIVAELAYRVEKDNWEMSMAHFSNTLLLQLQELSESPWAKAIPEKIDCGLMVDVTHGCNKKGLHIKLTKQSKA